MSGETYTIQLPTDKHTKLQLLINNTYRKKAVPLKTFQKLQGKLIHASIGMPNGRGLLAPIYNAAKHEPPMITITQDIKLCLKDWKQMAKQLTTTSTSILRLVPDNPHYIGYVDASGTAVGGVWTHGLKQLPKKFVWRMKWPQNIQNNLISKKNPHGTLSINDLEMVGVLLAWLILERIQPYLKHSHVGIFCDNQATVTWTNKHTTTTSTIASLLLRALAIRQHISQASPLLTTHIQGNNNSMADVASRSFTDHRFTNTNTPFIDIFNNIFPLQNDSWQEYTIPTKIFSWVTSCLHGQPLAMELWTRTTKKEKNTGNTGQNMSQNSKPTHISQTALKLNKLSSSHHLLQGSGQVTMAEEVLSKFNQSKMRLLPSQRPLNWLENTPQSTKQTKLTKSQWHGSLKATKGKTPHQHHKLQSQ